MRCHVNDNAVAIMDAAERRMRVGGFGGFSFRELAADVGVKSSSVHYHFPTKENLAAAVIRRYTQRVEAAIDKAYEASLDPLVVWPTAFRRSLQSDGRMCPVTVLGAAFNDLPPEVASEVRAFFTMCLRKIVASGLAPDAAAELLSTITGALILANALGDVGAYDSATRKLLREDAPRSARRQAAREDG